MTPDLKAVIIVLIRGHKSIVSMLERLIAEGKHDATEVCERCKGGK